MLRGSCDVSRGWPFGFNPRILYVPTHTQRRAREVAPLVVRLSLGIATERAKGGVPRGTKQQTPKNIVVRIYQVR